jgi:hypothetical protein
MLAIAAVVAVSVTAWFESIADRPFTRMAVRQAERLIEELHDETCRIEFSAIHSGAPQKITTRCSFTSREEAVTFLDGLIDHLPQRPSPSVRFEDETGGVREATLVWRQEPVGVESHLLRADQGWMAALVLVKGGPRIVIENPPAPDH